MKAALVISRQDDDRVKSFAKFWIEGIRDQDIFFASGHGTTWTKIGADGKGGPPLDPTSTPKQVDCLFIHSSDYDNSIDSVIKQLSKGWTAGFLFNQAGDPAGRKDFHRILRTTDPATFGLTKQHRDEIVDYIQNLASNRTVALPSCCCRSSSHLIAIDILAQCVLFAHGHLPIAGAEATLDDPTWSKRRDLTKDMSWWKKGLRVNNFADLEKSLLQENITPEGAREVINAATQCLGSDGSQSCSSLKQLRSTIKRLLE